MTGETLDTSSAAVQGRMGPRRSTPGWESQLLAELTSRPGTLAPCSGRRCRPAGPAATSMAARAHPREIPSATAGKGTRAGAAARTRRSAPTTCGIGRLVDRAGLLVVRGRSQSPHRPGAVFVVPRSMPTTIAGHAGLSLELGAVVNQWKRRIGGVKRISTSAGERTEESSRAAGRTGRWTDRTRQP